MPTAGLASMTDATRGIVIHDLKEHGASTEHRVNLGESSMLQERSPSPRSTRVLWLYPLVE